MQRPGAPPTPILLLLAGVVLIGIVAIPTIALRSSLAPAASSAAASPAPEGANPSKADRSKRRDKPAKAPEVEVTLNGTVGTRTTAAGQVEYTLTVGATTLTLDAGPAWFHKGKHPLQPFVGKTVTVVGGQREGSTEVAVQSVDGTVIRAAGKPPWAGGWKRVGMDHPAWSQEKWDKWQAKLAERTARFGTDCWPPGRCKTGAETRATPNATPEPSPGS